MTTFPQIISYPYSLPAVQPWKAPVKKQVARPKTGMMFQGGLPKVKSSHKHRPAMGWTV